MRICAIFFNEQRVASNKPLAVTNCSDRRRGSATSQNLESVTAD